MGEGRERGGRGEGEGEGRERGGRGEGEGRERGGREVREGRNTLLCNNSPHTIHIIYTLSS